MAEVIIREWLTDYKALSSSEVHSFASTIQQSNELIKAIFSILEEKKYHHEFLEPVCHQLFSFYRSREEKLQRFALQYLPTLIGIYLGAVARGERKGFKCVEVLLLSIYNLEVIDSSGKPVNQTFRIPSVAKPSIYHKPISLSHSMLTENALSNLEHGDSRTNVIGPYPEVEKINASNRLQVMTVLMWVYNQNIGLMSTFSHISLCKMCSRIVKQGYSRAGMSVWSSYNNDAGHGNPHPRLISRIPLSAPFLLEMLHASYFSIFNGLPSLGLQALEDINFRAVQDMLSDVILVTNAIRNSLKENPSGIPSDGPMGISVALSPTTTTTIVSKAAITNASFRTKKLPDDIPIQNENAANENHQLSAINEEGDDASLTNIASSRNPRRRGSTGSNNTIGSSVGKLPALHLNKDKNKERKKDKEAIIFEPNSNSRSKKEYELSTLLPVKNGGEITNVVDGSDTMPDLCTDRQEMLIKSSSFPGNFEREPDITSKNISPNSIPEKCEPNSVGGFSNNIENNTNMFINHARDAEETVITNDGKIILQTSLHKQDGEGGKGKQNSLQTVV